MLSAITQITIPSEVSEPEPTGNIALEIDVVAASGMRPSKRSDDSQSSGESLCDQHEIRGPCTIFSQKTGPTIVEQDTGSAPKIVTLPLEGLDTDSSSEPLDATSHNGPIISHTVPRVREYNHPFPLSASTSIGFSGKSTLDLVQRVGSDDDTFSAIYVSNDDNQVEYEDQRSTPPQSSSPLGQSSQPDIMSSPIQHAGFEANTNKSHVMTTDTNSTCQDVQESSNTAATAQLGKRKRCESLPRDKKHPVLAPNPKRLTIKSQHMQHEKLKSPFRSPLLSHTDKCTVEEPKSSPGRNGAEENPSSTRKFTQKVNNGKEMVEDKAVKKTKQRYRTAKAATQFKSPLPLDAEPKLGDMVRMTPDLQTLEHKLQALKRAVKIKQQNQQHVLEELVQKWTDAGREVAWELWSFVKDDDTSGKESYRSWNGTEWYESDDGKESSNPNNTDLLCAENIHEDEDSKDQETATSEEPMHNFGMMLRQLGIDPKTLGWKEEEGTFVDD